jgi:ABC-type lipoprotein export system ATPase subunit
LGFLPCTAETTLADSKRMETPVVALDCGAPIFRAAGLALHFDGGRTRALDGVNVEIGEGEFVAIVGASGCGKSSLLNLIGALDTPTAGERYFRNHPYSTMLDQADFRRRHIGFVFQSFHLIPTLGVLDNVLVPTIGTPGPANVHRARALALLERLGLTDRLQHFPATLSGGERQRAAIARALINNPDLLLADEPTGSLDSANAAQVLDLISDIRRERGLTVVMVTHDAGVSAHADRLVPMRDGKVAAA